jgi:hypothetical protein
MQENQGCRPQSLEWIWTYRDNNSISHLTSTKAWLNVMRTERFRTFRDNLALKNTLTLDLTL